MTYTRPRKRPISSNQQVCRRRLLKLYEDVPDFIQPETPQKRNDRLHQPGPAGYLRVRTTVTWGIPRGRSTPAHTMYVWVDALSNYITALGYGNDAYNDYDKFWPADLHMVGKEVLRFHTIIWPAMLMALDLPLPRRVFGHGWLLLDGGKMSKSKGNVVDPVVLCSRYGIDAIRYFLLREIPFGNDGVFSNEALIAHQFRFGKRPRQPFVPHGGHGGKVLRRHAARGAAGRAFDGELISRERHARRRDKCMDSLLIPQALAEIFRGIQRANKYIDGETAPWVLAKDEANRPRFAAVLYNLCETLRYASYAAGAPYAAYRAENSRSAWADAGRNHDAIGAFGTHAAYTVQKGEALFPAIDADKELEELRMDKEKTARAKSPAAPAPANAAMRCAARSICLR